ncbi:hypothetical protein BH11MYX1_BH11MYX1_08790 [soil metagenome]
MWRATALLVAVAACGGGGGDDGPTYPDQHPRIKVSVNADAAKAAYDSQSPAAVKFGKMVDRWVASPSSVYGFFPWNAAWMGQLSGDATYCTAAVAAIDKFVTSEQALIDGGSDPTVAGDDYYNLGDDIGDLALVYDWCYATIPSDRRQAWLGYAQQAVWNVWNPDDAKWGDTKSPWVGWAIDDPENNYYYNFLRATMLLGLAAHGEFDGIDEWLTQFHDTKVMGEMDPHFDANVVGGGSREGTGYGVSLRRLWELYDIWQASTGENLAIKSGHTRASMLFMMHEIVPTLDRIAPTGDQSRDSTASLFDYHRHFLQGLITLFPDDSLAPKAKSLIEASSVPEMSQQFMYGFDLVATNNVASSGFDGLNTAFYGSGTGQLFARSGWDKHATWINMNAGPYTQSHAHQDQGAIMIYKDGWLAYDPCVDSHSGLPQDIDDHGTLRVMNGSTPVKQKVGAASTMLALHQGTKYLHAAADLAPVYGTAVSKFQRELVYLEPDTVVIFDRVSSANSQVWSLAFPTKPTINGATTTVSAAGHTLTVKRLTETGASSSVHNYTDDSDFANGYRLDETVAGGDHAWLHVAYVDGGVTSVTATDATSADITLAGGTLVHVSFNPSSVGGMLKIGSDTVTLGASVDTLAE